MECIVLAGGLGTRLRSSIGDYPKCMAPVNDRPFLYYIFDYLERQHCSSVILSLGYRHEVVTDWLATQQPSFQVKYVIEDTPLGTGGGIQLAMKEAVNENVTVLNGDTFFDVPLQELCSFHTAHNSATTLALKEMQNFDRYGIVHTGVNDCITSFEEKKAREAGLINGGVYAINKQSFFNKHLPEKFSFEKDYLEAFVHEQQFFGYKSNAYFIDIGIPEDYAKTQEDFKSLFR